MFWGKIYTLVLITGGQSTFPFGLSTDSGWGNFKGVLKPVHSWKRFCRNVSVWWEIQRNLHTWICRIMRPSSENTWKDDAIHQARCHKSWNTEKTGKTECRYSTKLLYRPVVSHQDRCNTFPRSSAIWTLVSSWWPLVNPSWKIIIGCHTWLSFVKMRNPNSTTWTIACFAGCTTLFFERRSPCYRKHSPWQLTGLFFKLNISTSNKPMNNTTQLQHNFKWKWPESF